MNHSIQHYFRHVSHRRSASGDGVSPAAASFSHLTVRRGSATHGASGATSLSYQVQQLAALVTRQSQLLSQVSSLSGGASPFPGLLGGSPLGGIFNAFGGGHNAGSGFSFTSLLKDIFPLGGLVSGILGLFHSKPAAPVLTQYDAPPTLGFDAVLNSNGSISEGASGQDGFARGVSPGLNLVDAAGGPQSPYQRGADGLLYTVAGAPSSRYSGVLDLTSGLSGLFNASSSGAGAINSGQVDSLYRPAIVSPPAPLSVASSPAFTPVPAPISAPAAAPPSNNASLDSAAIANAVAAQLPAFDQQWFRDRGPFIAASVRDQMLNLHPLVDVVADL